MEIALRESTHQNWITFLLIGCILLLAMGKFFYNQSFFDTTHLLGADRFIATRTRGIFILQPLQLILVIMQCIGIPLLLYIVYCRQQQLKPREEMITYFFFVAGYAFFELSKFLLQLLASYALDIKKELLPLIHKRLNIKNLLALLSLMYSAICLYNTSIPLYILQLTVTSVAFLYVVAQLWLYFKYQNEIIRFPFYFILYFCTLEFAPFFILHKFIIK